MASLSRNEIQKRVLNVLEAHPQGIRWSDITAKIEAETPETNRNTIQGAIQNLFSTRRSEIAKVARGTYQLTRYLDAENASSASIESKSDLISVSAEVPGAAPLTEQDFYSSFAEWLEENDEATVASALGGSSLGGKWGTPDVIGVLKPRAQDIFKFEQQIVSAEIKAVPSQPVVAFGQAVAYRLFSHKSYMVIPNSTSSDDMNRLKSLCSIHGVGLGSGLIDHIQNMTIAAMAMADMKVWAQRS